MIQRGRGARPFTSHFFEHVGDRMFCNGRGPPLAQDRIFEAPNEIKDFAAREWSTGRGAKVSAATEWPIYVDQAIACFLLKHWARSISSFRQRFPTGRAKSLGPEDRFAFRQIRSPSGQFEMTAFGLAQAIALDRPLREIDINLSDFIQRVLRPLGKCILRLHSSIFGSTPAIACPAIHPVVQAAWKLKPPVMPSMSSSSPAK